MNLISINNLPEEPGIHNPEIKKKTILSEGYLPNIINFGLVTYTPGQIVKAHSHQDFFEVFYFISGKGRIQVNGVFYAIESPVCVVLDPYDVHEIINSGDDNLQHLFFQVLK